jgi:voltage-gated potassium channel
VMFRSLRAMFRDPEGKLLLGAAVIVLAIGTVAYMILEGWSPIDALYFSVVTLATVGFGDLHPTTDAAKLFTVLYILSGLGIIAAFLSEIPKYRHPHESNEKGDARGPRGRSGEQRGDPAAGDHATRQERGRS